MLTLKDRYFNENPLFIYGKTVSMCYTESQECWNQTGPSPWISRFVRVISWKARLWENSTTQLQLNLLALRYLRFIIFLSDWRLASIYQNILFLKISWMTWKKIPYERPMTLSSDHWEHLPGVIESRGPGSGFQARAAKTGLLENGPRVILVFHELNDECRIPPGGKVTLARPWYGRGGKVLRRGQ